MRKNGATIGMSPTTGVEIEQQEDWNQQVRILLMKPLARFGAGPSPIGRRSSARPTVSRTCRRTSTTTSTSVFASPGLIPEKPQPSTTARFMFIFGYYRNLLLEGAG